MADSQLSAHRRLPRMRPVSDLASDRPHGDQLRYIAGCRCEECRKANADRERKYAQLRKSGMGNPVVPADAAREHLRRLSEAGVGIGSVVDATGVSRAILGKIKAGTRKNIRRANEQKILAVPMDYIADGAFIDAGPTWNLINKTMEDGGFTRQRIAQAVHGPGAKKIWLSKKLVTLRSAVRVRKACAALMASGERMVSSSTAKRLIALMLRDTLNDRRTVAREIGCSVADLDLTQDCIPLAFSESVERAYKIITT